MTKKYISVLFLFLCITDFLYSQVTITDIAKTEEKIVMKPEPFDSLKNWEYHERLGDYKQYIGLQIYLPPIFSCHIGEYNCSNMFLYSIKPSIIKTNVETSYEYIPSASEQYIPSGHGHYAKYVYDSLITFVYKPFHYYSGIVNGSLHVCVCSDSNEVSNKYFTILDVFYANKIDSILNSMENYLSEFDKKNTSDKIFVHYMTEEYYDKPKIIYLVKNNKTNDSLYCFHDDKFVLVPYFVKQKELYKNQKLIYDNKDITEYDPRYNVKSENNFGNEIISGKEVKVKKGSEWYCIDVSLLKPLYNINYLLKNDSNQQIAVSKIDGFILKKDYSKRENEKKIKADELISQKKKEALLEAEKKKKEKDLYKATCINKYGQTYGELISEGKVEIGMSEEMCKDSWGVPYNSYKTTTTEGNYEDWYYGWKYSLHFENNTLIRIEN